MNPDTIAAISTPPGEGGIGIVRISGPHALPILQRLFRPHRPSWTSHLLVHGRAVWDEEPIDEVLAVYMQAPRSFTGEDVAEFQAHGSSAALRRILEATMRAGARLAEPGEFTRRAFLNGRMDLSQAEAVIDIIRARTDAALRQAMRQLGGSLSTRVRQLREEILAWLAALEAQIDFPDDDIPPLPRSVLNERVDGLLQRTDELLQQAHSGQIVRDGARVALVGKPNVGKSSLLNALLGTGRAIVTDIPGTTRDTIEDWINLHGVPVCLIDTAGIREADDRVESLGVERSRRAIEQADLVVVMVDGSRPFDAEDEALIPLVERRDKIVVWNKTDLRQELQESDIMRLREAAPLIRISLQQGDVARVQEALLRTLIGSGQVGEGLVASPRHQDALLRARRSLSQVRDTIQADLPVDFLTIDLRAALEAFGEVTGQSITEDILDRIFSDFCLGK